MKIGTGGIMRSAEMGSAGSTGTPQRYGAVAILLHWLLALLLIVAFAMGTYMVDIPGITSTKLRLFNWHKWLGVGILLLATLRLLWRLTHRAPAVPLMPAWQRAAAAVTHGLLYLLMLAIPLSGYFYSLTSGFPVVWFGVMPLPVLIDADPALKPLLQGLHYWLNMTLLVLVALHLAAVVKHQLIDRDGLLWRMLPGRTRLGGDNR
jgi:cytochrome b561